MSQLKIRRLLILITCILFILVGACLMIDIRHVIAAMETETAGEGIGNVFYTIILVCIGGIIIVGGLVFTIPVIVSLIRNKETHRRLSTIYLILFIIELAATLGFLCDPSFWEHEYRISHFFLPVIAALLLGMIIYLLIPLITHKEKQVSVSAKPVEEETNLESK